MRIFFVGLFFTAFYVADSYFKRPRPVRPDAAAVISAPFVGCEPGHLNILRLENVQGHASWAVQCNNKEFVCGMSRGALGHTIFCHQVGCSGPPKETGEGKHDI